MSKWSEALELAKAGFKAGEIREMWDEKDLIPAETQPDPEPVQETKEPADNPEPEKDPEPEENPKYKELENKYNALLKETQKNNTMKDISLNDNQKTTEEQGYDVLASIWR